jgi:Zn-dependent membrane protease YugP
MVTMGTFDFLRLAFYLLAEIYYLCTGKTLDDSGQLSQSEIMWRANGGAPLSDTYYRINIMRIRLASTLLALLLLFVAVSSACNVSGGGSWIEPTTRSPLATEQVSLVKQVSQPSATAKPTQTLDPGLAATGTSIALQAVQLAQAQTLQALAAGRGEMTATADTSTRIAQATNDRATETAMVWRTEIAPTAFVAQKNAERQVMIENIGLYIFAFVLFGACLMFLVFGLARVRTIEIEAQISLEEAKMRAAQQKKQEAPRLIVETRKEEVGRLQVDWETLPLEFDALERVLRMLQDGLPYTQANFCGKDKPLSKSNGASKGSFEMFGDWLIANRLAYKMGDGRYAMAGNAIKVLEGHLLLPHSGETDQKTA